LFWIPMKGEKKRKGEREGDDLFFSELSGLEGILPTLKKKRMGNVQSLLNKEKEKKSRGTASRVQRKGGAAFAPKKKEK